MHNLRETLKNNAQGYIRHLSDLVGIDTHVLGHGREGGLELKGQLYLETLFEKMGANDLRRDPLNEAVILEGLERYNEGNPGHRYENRYNLYATFKGNGGKSLLLNGHMDTMPAGDEALWTTPPHTPTLKDGRLYGLGSCDMKGGLMAAVMAVKLLQDAGIELPGDVTIASVVDEEGGGNGSITAAMNGVSADAVVVCEPTGDELVAAHMGFVFFKVDVVGKAVHSGAKCLGVSAIEKAIQLILALSELERSWQQRYRHRLLPPPSLNVGTISGGTAGSTVASACSFEVCVHYLPGSMSHGQVVKEFNDVLEKASDNDMWLAEHRPVVAVYQAGGGFEMELGHPFVKAFHEAYGESLERPLRTAGSPAGCDSRIWRNIAGCPTLQFGPGQLAQCHAVDEYLCMDAYLESILIYAELILNWSRT